jgi:hypothetical protein
MVLLRHRDVSHAMIALCHWDVSHEMIAYAIGDDVSQKAIDM